MLDLFRYLKIQYKDYLILFKIGSFYTSFGEDAIILNKVFNYKLVDMKNNIKAGFPLTNYEKNINIIEKLKINYIIIEKENITNKKKFKFNNYCKYVSNVYYVIENRKRIDNILKKLNAISDNKDIGKLLDKIEGDINEWK